MSAWVFYSQIDIIFLPTKQICYYFLWPVTRAIFSSLCINWHDRQVLSSGWSFENNWLSQRNNFGYCWKSGLINHLLQHSAAFSSLLKVTELALFHTWEAQSPLVAAWYNQHYRSCSGRCLPNLRCNL